MFAALLSGLRSLRVSLVAGAMLMGSAYIFMHDTFANQITIRPAAQSLIKISSAMPIILIVLLCVTVGSLYTTLLEGIVDWLHRKNVHKIITGDNTLWERAIVRSFLPYSDSARIRLISEVTRFYREHSNQGESGGEQEDQFVEKVLIETLWMEGKLAGTPLEAPYDKIRSEGEMRVSGGLLLPTVGAAAAYSMFGTDFQLATSLLVGVFVAVPMVNYGLYYYRKANSFLAHHIADGKLLSPSMETQKRASSASAPPQLLRVDR